MEIELFNFQRWNHKTIVLEEGLNLFVGKSGAGKSTICRAIYFLLFGGRKHKNLTTKGSTEKTTYVEMRIKENSVKIRRERPSERVYVSYKDKEGKKIKLSNEEAQFWIHSKFGTEETWICSSYLAQGKDHFLLKESNADKRELLNQITFGDESNSLTPNYYIEKLNNIIYDDKKKLTKISNELRARQIVLEKTIKKLEDKSNIQEVTEEEIESLKTDIKEKERKLAQLKIQYESYIKKSKELEELTSELDSLNIEELTKKLELQNKINEYIKAGEIFNDFFVDCLIYEEQEIKDTYLSYEYYISKGYNKNKDIKKFINLEQQKRDKYLEYLNDKEKYESIKDKLKEIKDIKEKNKQISFNNCNLSKLKSFDIDVFNYKEEDIYSNKEIYTLLKRLGWSSDENVEEFIESRLNKYKEYKEYTNKIKQLEESNQQIIQMNNEITKRNKQVLKEANDKYNNYVNEINSRNADITRRNDLLTQNYNDKINKKNRILRSLNLKNIPNQVIEPNKLTKEDNLTIDFLNELKQKYNKQICEEFCPHCSKSFVYDNNGKIQKGSFVSLEDVIKIKQQIVEIDEQIEIRKIYNGIQKILELNIEEPKLEELIDIMSKEKYIGNINQESLFPLKEIEYLSFDDNINTYKNLKYPTIDYTKLKYLLHSLPLVELYNQYKDVKEEKLLDVPEVEEYKEPIYTEDSNLDKFIIPRFDFKYVSNMYNSLPLKYSYLEYKKNELNGLEPIKENIKEKLESITSLQTKINILIEDLKEFNKKEYKSNISDLKKEIESLNINLNEKIVAKDYYENKKSLDKYISKETKALESLNKKQQLLDHIREVADSSVNNMIESLNSSLEIICSELFENPINVCISTKKELKNGKEKNEINLEVTHNGNAYDINTEFSGGEQKRISLALLLAFMKINNSPICILDESLPFLDGELKEKSIEMIKEWTSGKFVIHICHEITEGIHDNVIVF